MWKGQNYRVMINNLMGAIVMVMLVACRDHAPTQQPVETVLTYRLASVSGTSLEYDYKSNTILSIGLLDSQSLLKVGIIDHRLIQLCPPSSARLICLDSCYHFSLSYPDTINGIFGSTQDRVTINVQFRQVYGWPDMNVNRVNDTVLSLLFHKSGNDSLLLNYPFYVVNVVYGATTGPTAINDLLCYSAGRALSQIDQIRIARQIAEEEEIRCNCGEPEMLYLNVFDLKYSKINK